MKTTGPPKRFFTTAKKKNHICSNRPFTKTVETEYNPKPISAVVHKNWKRIVHRPMRHYYVGKQVWRNVPKMPCGFEGTEKTQWPLKTQLLKLKKFDTTMSHPRAKLSKQVAKRAFPSLRWNSRKFCVVEKPTRWTAISAALGYLVLETFIL